MSNQVENQPAVLIMVEKAGNKLKVVQEDFRKNANELIKEFFNLKPGKNQGFALIGKGREKFISKGISIPQTIRIATPI